MSLATRLVIELYLRIVLASTTVSPSLSDISVHSNSRPSKLLNVLPERKQIVWYEFNL